jgi:hypothetical protein
MNAILRFILNLILIMASSSMRADEPITSSRGIAVEAKRLESERVLETTTGSAITLHLRNDTAGAVVFQAIGGDCTSGKAVLRAEHVLVVPPEPNAVTPLVSWLGRSLVFHKEPSMPFMMYIAKPGDEFDVVISLSALRDAKDAKSPRGTLAKGRYRAFLDLYKAEDWASAPKRGLFPEPLLTYIIQVQ